MNCINMNYIIFPQVKTYNILDMGDLEALKCYLSKIITCKNVLQLYSKNNSTTKPPLPHH